MCTTVTTLPARSPDLVLGPFQKQGEYVAKNRRQGTYFKLGEFEYFLLLQLDGKNSSRGVRDAFEQRFGESLSRSELDDFVKMATERGFLATESSNQATIDSEDDEDGEMPAQAGVKRKQSILNFRYSVFDPDQFFTWFEPKIRFVWTRGFLIVSALFIACAALMLWTNRGELASSFARTRFGWEAVAILWLTVVVVTTLHEFAHGLTCKHYGGEVHELGVLVMFFTPCFYCNVSDAWLIPEKSKRLWITAAGAYCDMCLWALAACVWRVTIQDSLINYVAWIVASVCGTRLFFNFNPMMKLDGYYLLSDWLEIPNLRRLSHDRWMSFVRWVLWGAERPAPQEHGRVLIAFGFVKWIFAAIFIDMVLMGLFKLLGTRWGLIGIACALWLSIVIVKRVFRGFFAGEALKMIKQRKFRTASWAVCIGALPVALFIGRAENRSVGTFEVRPAKRVEVRAEVAGFLREVTIDEGAQVSANAIVAKIDVPDLDSQIAQKLAQIGESQANLRRLTAGPRPEEVREQRFRVERATAWRDLAKNDLSRAKLAMQEDLNRLDQQVAQVQAEYDYLQQVLATSERMYQKGVLAGQQFRAEKKKSEVTLLQLQQVRAQKRAREAAGLLDAEAELARRTKELADVNASLKLLEAGSRPEEIDAERARGVRLQEELNFLKATQERLVIRSPLAGLVTTARMTEKIGQYLEKGALICVIEDATGLDAEIVLTEQEVSGVKAGQLVELKARALPYETFNARVDRVAPRAKTVEGALQGTVVVYCHLDDKDANLLAGMTGVGRVFRGQESLGTIACDRAMRYVRTEFWW